MGKRSCAGAPSVDVVTSIYRKKSTSPLIPTEGGKGARAWAVQVAGENLAI